MNDERLRRELRETPLPGEAEARERGWRVVRAAFEDRSAAAPRRRRDGRLAIALAGAALVLAIVLTPAGAKVVDALRSVTGIGNGNASPSLSSLPAPGRVLVSSSEGPWVVHGDGSRRLLGDYPGGAATWSPHGLFVAVAHGHGLSAVEPETGTVRWALGSNGSALTRDPAWSPSGFRIAYLSGNDLRLVDGHGRFDHALVRHVARTAPAWQPLDAAQRRAAAGGFEPAERLAFADRAGRIHVVIARTGQSVWTSQPGPKRPELLWSGDGSRLIAVSAHVVRLFTVAGRPAGSIGFPRGTRVEPAASAVAAGRLAVTVATPRRAAAPRSRIELFRLASPSRAPRTLVSDPGRFTSLAFAPNGRWLLAAWRDADQWLFIPLAGGKVKAVGHISRQFAPGTSGPSAFPRVDGWCCSR